MEKMKLSLLEKLFIFEEGFRTKRYICSKGHPTIGIGHKLLKSERFVTITKEQALELFQKDITIARKAANKYSWFKDLNEPRQAIILSMIFQLGAKGFADFKQTIRYIEIGQFNAAANEMLDSAWAKQTPNRARRHSKQFMVGGWIQEYVNFNIEM